MFPNPTQNIVNIKLFKEVSNNKIQILDFVGRLMKQEMCYSNDIEIDISSLPAGLYFVKIENNGIFSTQKLIKQ